MPSYDVFLSCKSEDYAYAGEVYNFLTQNGVRVFLASRELRRLGDAEYRRQIVKALDQSKHIIVFASNKAYINTIWVEFEWSTFQNEILAGRKHGNIMTVLKGIRVDDIDLSLRQYQSFSYYDYKRDLLQYVGVHREVNPCPKPKPKPTPTPNPAPRPKPTPRPKPKKPLFAPVKKWCTDAVGKIKRIDLDVLWESVVIAALLFNVYIYVPAIWAWAIGFKDDRISYGQDLVLANIFSRNKSINELGNVYYSGIDIEQSYAKAVEYYKEAADDGYAAAQTNLGNCYYNGEGVTQSYEEAVKYYKLAAEQGYSHAQNNLGNRYYDGRGITQSYKEAVKYYKLAAEQGYDWAQYNLGNCYYYGKGVKQSYAEAVEFYRLAANQGLAEAQNMLGVCYYCGNGVKQNYKEAVKYYRLAAEQGYDWAQYNLGNRYYDGNGVTKSVSEATKWYKLAAEQGNEDAKAKLAQISRSTK